jgi:SPX domain protein involved in polyphosphate accumulation
MLENYAVLNYCGLSKILKKHDKCTGFVTREKFMMNMVVRQVRVGPVSFVLGPVSLFCIFVAFPVLIAVVMMF